MTVAVPEVEFISPIVGILAIVLGLYMLLLNPYLNSTRAFFIAMMFGSVTAFMDFLLVNAANEGQAIAIGRGVLAFVVFFHAALLYLTAFLPYTRDDDWLIQKRKVFFVISLALGLLVAFIVEGAAKTSYGWGIPYSPALFLTILIIASISIVGSYKLYRVYEGSEKKEVRTQCLLLTIGLMSPIVWDLILMIEEVWNTDWPPEMVIGYIPTLVTFLFVIMKHRLFLVSPVEEHEISLDIGITNGGGVGEGCCYLLEGKKSDEAYRILLQEMAEGAHALVITRTHPDIIREQYGLVKTPIIWLASQPGPERMDPTSLSIFQHTVTEFAKKGENTLIFLDGLEYLIINNPIDRVLRLIYALKDELLLTNSKLLVPMDPDVLEPRDLALFEREFEVLELE